MVRWKVQDCRASRVHRMLRAGASKTLLPRRETVSNEFQHSKSGVCFCSVSIASARSHNHCDWYYLYAAFFSISIFTMPVTPNIQILRVLDRWPFSTRSRDERRLRSQRSAPQLRPCTPQPASSQPCQTIYLRETAVAVIDHGSSDLNIQSQQSLCLAPDPPESPLNRLRHKTSKWFADKRAAKGKPTVSRFPHTSLSLRQNRALMRLRHSASESSCNSRLTCVKGSERDAESSSGNQSPSRNPR